MPSDDQWKYAAQGDDGRIYPWGNEWDRTRCNNSVDNRMSEKTTPVDLFEGKGDSPFGVVDMVGNVSEWCRDIRFDPDNRIDFCVALGGDWKNSSSESLAIGDGYFYSLYGSNPLMSLPSWFVPELRDNSVGFRIARL